MNNRETWHSETIRPVLVTLRGYSVSFFGTAYRVGVLTTCDGQLTNMLAWKIWDGLDLASQRGPPPPDLWWMDTNGYFFSIFSSIAVVDLQFFLKPPRLEALGPQGMHLGSSGTRILA